MTTPELRASTFLSFPPSPESQPIVKAKTKNAGDGKHAFVPKHRITGIYESSTALTNQVLEVRDICTRSAILLASHPTAHIRTQTALTSKEIQSVKSDCSKGTTTFCSLKDKQARGLDAMDTLLRSSGVPRRERHSETLAGRPMTRNSHESTTADYAGLAVFDPFMPFTPKESIEHGMKIVNLLSLPGRAITSVCNSTDTTKRVCSVAGEEVDLVLSLPLRAIDGGVKGVKMLCDSSDTTKKACSTVRAGVDFSMSVAGKAATLVAEKTRELIPAAPFRTVVPKLDISQSFERDFGIPAKDTAYFLESCGIVKRSLDVGIALGGTYAVAKIASQVASKTIRSLSVNSDIGKEVTLYLHQHQLPQGRVLFSHAKISSDNSLYIMVHNLEAASGVKTSGVVFRMLSEFEKFARDTGATRLLLDLGFPVNPRLLDLMKKRFSSPLHQKKGILEGVRPLPIFTTDLTKKASTTGANPTKFDLIPKTQTPVLQTQSALSFAQMHRKAVNRNTFMDKRDINSKTFLLSIKKEKELFRDLKKTTPSFKLPTDFPKNLSQFYSQCEIHSFKKTNLGPNKNGSIEGRLLYKLNEERALFVLEKRKKTISAKIPDRVLFKSTNLNSQKRTDFLLETAINFAKEKGFKKIVLVWDTNKFPVATTIKSNSKSILSTGTFSQFAQDETLSLVEISVP